MAVTKIWTIKDSLQRVLDYREQPIFTDPDGHVPQEGASKQVAASLLGHADTAFLERTYCHPQDVAKQHAAKLMQDLLNNQNPCYVAFMKNKNRKAKKAG